MGNKTLADLLFQEAKQLHDKHDRGTVYLSYPYTCCLTEAMSHASNYEYPPAKRLAVKRQDRQTLITLKPIPGLGKRKPFTIKLWIA